MSKVTEEMLDKLFCVTVAQLTQKIKSGEATAGDFSAAIKLLKDNSIVIHTEIDNPLSELDKILKDIKFEDVEEYDVK